MTEKRFLKNHVQTEEAIQLLFHWGMNSVFPFSSIHTDINCLKVFVPNRMGVLSCRGDDNIRTEEGNGPRLVTNREGGALWCDGVDLKKIVHGIVWIFMSGTCFAETVHMSMTPDKRIMADISKDSMNRIAINGDRITQVFGDSDAYELQTEETSGQVFIKPIFENGDKPLSLTLITEKSVTQDLLLRPCDKEAVTVILKSTYTPRDKLKDDRGEIGGLSLNSSYISFPDSSARFNESSYPTTYQDTLLIAMKKLATEEGPVLQEDHGPERLLSKDHQEALTISFKSAYHLGSFKGYAFDIKNITETPIELNEDHFFKQGDLALSLNKNTLKSQESTTLFVVVEC